MTFARASGILLHPTSLPGPHGIGDLGAEAYRFVDWLAAGGAKGWQGGAPRPGWGGGGPGKGEAGEAPVWLDSFARFMALKIANAGVAWTDWKPDVEADPEEVEF